MIVVNFFNFSTTNFFDNFSLTIYFEKIIVFFTNYNDFCRILCNVLHDIFFITFVTMIVAIVFTTIFLRFMIVSIELSLIFRKFIFIDFIIILFLIFVISKKKFVLMFILFREILATCKRLFNQKKIAFCIDNFVQIFLFDC